MAAQLGYCGLDRRRQPLSGDEIRSCWESWPAGAAHATTDAPLSIVAAAADDGRKRPLEFVEIDGVSESVEDDGVAESPLPGPPLPTAAEPGWSLWGDLDR